MPDFQSSVIVKKPVQAVFQYIASMKNTHELMPAVVKVEKQTDGEIKQGTKFVETRMVGGREVQAEMEILEYTEKQSFCTSTNSNGLITEYHYRFHEVEEGTQVDLEAYVKTSGLRMKLTRPILVKMMKREDGNQLINLKDMLDAEEVEADSK